MVVLTALLKVQLNKCMQKRSLCEACGKKPSAVNYKRNDKTYYRSRCDGCIRKRLKKPVQKPSWIQSGYKKKPSCEKCGFKAKYKEQLFVYYVDGNLNNNHHLNLKTICANCQYEIAKEGLGWAQGDLVPDF